MKFSIFILVIFFLIIPFTVALTQEERTLIEQQNQKMVAQLSSKIDSQVARIEKNMQVELEQSTRFVKDEISNSVKSHLKAVAIGLSGLMIITLSVFRVIDLKYSTVRGIKRYEEELKTKIKNNDEIKKKLMVYKKQLEEYQTKLETMQQGTFLSQPMLNPQTNIPVPEQKEGLAGIWKKIFLWAIFVIVILIIIISGVVFITLQFVK